MRCIRIHLDLRTELEKLVRSLQNRVLHLANGIKPPFENALLQDPI
jgi:hypothetical protein